MEALLRKVDELIALLSEIGDAVETLKEENRFLSERLEAAEERIASLERERDEVKRMLMGLIKLIEDFEDLVERGRYVE